MLYRKRRRISTDTSANFWISVRALPTFLSDAGLIACLHLLDFNVEGPLLVVALFALRVSLIVDMDRKIKREVERIGPQDHTGLSEEHEKQVPWIFLARIQKKGLPESASK